MSWLTAIGPGFLILVAFFLPGTAILLAARVPWRIAIPVAPAVSVTVATVGAVLAEPLNIRWGAGPFAVTSLAIALIALGLGSWIWPGRLELPYLRATPWWALAGVVVAAPIAVIPLAAGFGSPDAPALSFDAIFHLNALRHILETGDASTLTLGAVASSGVSAEYYPAGWHDMVAVVMTGTPVALYANVTTLVIAGVVYPVGLAFLAATVFPSSRIMAFVAPILGSGFVAFPARMFTYGTLWPAGLSTALLPPLIGLVILLFSSRLVMRQRLQLVIVLLVALAGASFAHPTAFFATALLTAPFLLWQAWRFAATKFRAGYRWSVIVVVALIPVLLVATWFIVRGLPYVRGVIAYKRPGLATHAQAIGEALFDSMLANSGHGNATAFWTMGALTVLGFVLLTRHRDKWWLLASYGAAVVFYALAAGPDVRLRALVGFWYKDPVRLGGLVPIFATLLASFAVIWLATIVAATVRQWRDKRWRPRSGTLTGARPTEVIAVFLVAGMVVVSGGLRVTERTWEATREYTYQLTQPKGLLSTPELDMIKRLGSELPEDAVVLGNPKNGSAFVYALTGRHVVFAHVKGSFGPEREYLARNFHNLNTDPEVCHALAALGVDYFYDDPNLYPPGATKLFDDLNADGLTHGLRAIEHGGSATVYEITACDSMADVS